MCITKMAALKGVLGYRGIGQILRGILNNFVNIKSIFYEYDDAKLCKSE